MQVNLQRRHREGKCTPAERSQRTAKQSYLLSNQRQAGLPGKRKNLRAGTVGREISGARDMRGGEMAGRGAWRKAGDGGTASSPIAESNCKLPGESQMWTAVLGMVLLPPSTPCDRGEDIGTSWGVHSWTGR